MAVFDRLSAAPTQASAAPTRLGMRVAKPVMLSALAYVWHNRQERPEIDEEPSMTPLEDFYDLAGALGLAHLLRPMPEPKPEAAESSV